MRRLLKKRKIAVQSTFAEQGSTDAIIWMNEKSKLTKAQYLSRREMTQYGKLPVAVPRVCPRVNRIESKSSRTRPGKGWEQRRYLYCSVLRANGEISRLTPLISPIPMIDNPTPWGKTRLFAVKLGCLGCQEGGVGQRYQAVDGMGLGWMGWMGWIGWICWGKGRGLVRARRSAQCPSHVLPLSATLGEPSSDRDALVVLHAGAFKQQHYYRLYS